MPDPVDLLEVMAVVVVRALTVQTVTLETEVPRGQEVHVDHQEEAYLDL